MFYCPKCGALIDLGGTEYDCPRGCFDSDEDDSDTEEIEDL